MAVFTPHPIVVPGDTWTASNQITYVKNNEDAIFVGTTRGDMDFYSSSNTKSRLALAVGGILYGGALDPAWLAKPTVDSILKNTSAGVPSWLAFNAIPGILHASADVSFNPAGQHNNSGAYVDITGGTVNIVTTKTCTIEMFISGMIATVVQGVGTYVRGSIGGVEDPASSVPFTTIAPNYVPFAYIYKRTGVAAGTIICKARFLGGDGYFDSGQIHVKAYTE